ncbi:MAG: phosphoglucosamine mutase [Bacteriovoracaceae bacterium]|nr:phosphoglucosamine mutase [Bacteriovoracaceae bacterium]
MTKRKLFGTDGVRGKANLYPITGEIAMALGRAVTHYFQKLQRGRTPLIIIGKDTRLSCYMIEQAFASGVCSQGGRAILTGPLPTPGVAFVVQSMRADAGVMISASHNPFHDNGIKIFDNEGNKLPDAVELELEKMTLGEVSLPLKSDGELGRTKRIDEIHGRYIVHVKSALGSDCSLAGLRLIVDGANGAAYRVAPMVFEELGAEVVSMGDNPNGKNINLMCGSLFPKNCADMVSTYRADLGICLDGDGDRLTMINERSQVVHGDRLIGVCAKFLLDKGELGPGDEVVGTTMSNLGLEKFIEGIGLKFHRADVGDRYILERMKKSGAILGGEPSGHIIFRQFSTTGDGILAALKILEAVKFYQRPLCDLIGEITLFPQVMENVRVATKPEFDQVEAISKALKKTEKELGDSGRVILRYSGTEALARVMIEGESEKEILALCKELAEVVKKALN